MPELRDLLRPQTGRLVLGCLLVGSLAACRHAYTVENRETPVHVWLTAPDLAAQGGSVQALIYVGAHKVIEGPVSFPRGVPNISIPPVYTIAGTKRVSVVIDGGRIRAEKDVQAAGETWVRITLRGQGAQIERFGQEPCAPAGSTFFFGFP